MWLKLYLAVSGFIFLLVSIFHWFRLAHGWPIVVGPRVVPMWLSVIGGPVSLAYTLWAAWLLFSSRRARQRQRETTVPR